MDSKNIDLKQTINLPRTDFPMKANLPVAEPKMLAAWAAENLNGQIRATSAGRPMRGEITNQSQFFLSALPAELTDN